MPAPNLSIIVKMSGGSLPPNSRAGDVEVYDNGRLVIYETDTDIVERQLDRQQVVDILAFARQSGFFQLSNVIHDGGNAANVPDVTISLTDQMSSLTVTVTNYQRLRGEMRKDPFDLVYKKITDTAWESYTNGKAPSAEPVQSTVAAPAAPQPTPAQVPALPFSAQSAQSNPAPVDLPSLDDLLKSSNLDFGSPGTSAAPVQKLPPLSQQTKPTQAGQNMASLPTLQTPATNQVAQGGMSLPPLSSFAPPPGPRQPNTPQSGGQPAPRPPQPSQPAPKQAAAPQVPKQIVQQPVQPAAPAAAPQQSQRPPQQQPAAPARQNQQRPPDVAPVKAPEQVQVQSNKPTQEAKARVQENPNQQRDQSNRNQSQERRDEKRQPEEQSVRQQKQERPEQSTEKREERQNQPERSEETRQPQQPAKEPQRPEQKQVQRPPEVEQSRPRKQEERVQTTRLQFKHPPVGWEHTQEIIGRLEESLKGKLLVVYVASDHEVTMDDMRYLYSHLRKGGNKKTLYVLPVIQSGQLTVVWRMATLLREFCQELVFVLPEAASVYTTMLALSGDSIMMNPLGYLSPIETPFKHALLETDQTLPLREILQSAQSGMMVSTNSKSKTAAMEQTQTIHPLVITAAQRQFALTQLLCSNLLKLGKKGAKAESEVANIVEQLTNSYPSSDYPITLGEVKTLGLTVKETTEEMNDLLWELLKNYSYLTQAAISLRDNYRSVEQQAAIIESDGRRTLFFKEVHEDQKNERIMEEHNRWRELTMQLSISQNGKEHSDLQWKELQISGHSDSN